MNRKKFIAARIFLAIAILFASGFFPQPVFADDGKDCQEENRDSEGECPTPTSEPTDTATPTPTETPEEPEASCKLSISSQDFNVVEISFGVSGSGDYPGHIDWGDESGFDVSSGSGQAGHGYAYNSGGVTEWTIVLTVVGGNSPCKETVTIDDTPLPSPEAACALTATDQKFNVLRVKASVIGQGDYPGHLSWGDGPSVDLASGEVDLEHGYSYNVGGEISYTAILVVDGAPAPCSLSVVIDDSPENPNPTPEKDRGSEPSPTPSTVYSSNPTKGVSPNGWYRVETRDGELWVIEGSGREYPVGVEGENPIFLADWTILVESEDGLILTDRLATFVRHLGVSGKVSGISHDGKWINYVENGQNMVVSIHGSSYGQGLAGEGIFSSMSFSPLGP